MTSSDDAPETNAVANPDAFADLGLAPAMVRAIATMGFEQPTPIQSQAIPVLLAGRDLLGQAQTGTGKTAAFGLPMLQNLTDRAGVQAIVLTPTRELAIQVADALADMGKHVRARVLAVYGGQPIHVQMQALRRGANVVIGTPGRVRDHLERGTLDLSQVSFFGLDEADEMLAMGFIEDVEWILDHAPPERQIALFSATLPPEIRRVATKYLRDPADIQIARRAINAPKIEQRSLRVVGRFDKDNAVSRILEAEDEGAVLVFTSTRMACDQLTERLQSEGHPVESVHGGMNQPQREQVVARLRSGRTRVVVATDVAARGLDVDQIGLVINYDLPREDEVYVHRIGRTGRAGREGRSITLWRPPEGRRMQSIERTTGQRMEPMRLPSAAELVARRRDRFAEQVLAIAKDEELPAAFEDLARGLAQESGLSAERIAAAALRLGWGESPIAFEERGRRASRSEPRPAAAQASEPRPAAAHASEPRREVEQPVANRGQRERRAREAMHTDEIAPVAIAPAAIVSASSVHAAVEEAPVTEAVVAAPAEAAAIDAPMIVTPIFETPVETVAIAPAFLAPAASLESGHAPTTSVIAADDVADDVIDVAVVETARESDADVEPSPAKPAPRATAPAQEPRRERKLKQPPRPVATGQVEIVLSVGNQDGLTAGEVVGTIAGETRLPGSVVGKIDIHERVTFVAVPAEHADAIVARLGSVRIRDRQLRARLAHPATPAADPRGPVGPSSFGGNRRQSGYEENAAQEPREERGGFAARRIASRSQVGPRPVDARRGARARRDESHH